MAYGAGKGYDVKELQRIADETAKAHKELLQRERALAGLNTAPTPAEEEKQQRKHGVHPSETFLSVRAVNKNGKITFVVDHVTRYLVSGSYLDKVVETANERAMERQR